MIKIVFMGTPDFSVPILQTLVQDGYEVQAVVTQPDRPVGRKRILTPPPVKVEAVKQNIPVLQPEKMKGSEEMQQIIDLKPDLIVTAAYGQILPKALLDSPKLGCINVHASLLPELRGGAPIHYAILQGKKKTGVTIMYMVEKLDAGDMISQIEVPIEEQDHVGILHDKLSEAGAKLLSETLPKLINGETTPTPQDEKAATFAFNIKREEEKIDWSRTGEEIYNHIRGLHPWPVAYTTLDGKVMKIWWGEKMVAKENPSPGEIIAIEKDGLIVSTGNQTSIKVTELQLAGKKRMKAEQYLRGSNLEVEVGKKLGDNDEK
ncbi:methionyl-tRNA formyltransferase [Oikeobacillus pervagus]|uniref:Methionyl-tRNA formyltransferase n=1 Tax=Oikeobacillus pervagus TaxID=1325931 RepID=A0AAJ1T599_9BACI|nr:methionyl-tRNA formyltransferase [Oikeobacillus pervagus]MDQ0215075.1 methionyl-tRNA formyltransferase [Oikeobacillus pervagus]